MTSTCKIEVEQKLNSIQSWEGSQTLSGTLPLISITDIKGTVAHWPAVTCLRRIAVHYFNWEQMCVTTADLCFMEPKVYEIT